MKGKGILVILGVVAVAAAGFAVGRMSGQPIFVPEKVKRVFPLLPPPPKDQGQPDSPVAQAAVVIEMPAENAELSGAFEVSGRFLNDGRKLTVLLKDGDGQTLHQASATLKSVTDSKYGRFQATVKPPRGAGGQAVIEIMSVLKDGSLSGPEAARIVSLPPAQPQEIKVYFTNSRLDPAISCTQTYPVKRTVVAADGNLKLAALKSLLEGPTEDEQADGYASSLPDGAKVLSVEVDGLGRAVADFSQELDQDVAGACRVSSIRAQIIATLGQFQDVRQVTVSVEGDSQESLQP